MTNDTMRQSEEERVRKLQEAGEAYLEERRRDERRMMYGRRLDELERTADQMRRAYERPEQWEEQIERMHEALVACGVPLLRTHIFGPTHDLQTVLGSMAVALFFRGFRYTGPVPMAYLQKLRPSP